MKLGDILETLLSSENYEEHEGWNTRSNPGSQASDGMVDALYFRSDVHLDA